MLGRSCALAALLALLVAVPAWAAPVTVQLRVEGSAGTIFEGPVTTDGKAIDQGDGPHRCDGTNGGKNPASGPTMTSALDDAGLPGGWGGTWDTGFDDFFLSRIGTEAQNPAAGLYWGYWLNLKDPLMGGCQARVAAGDEVLFAFDAYVRLPHFLRLEGPAKVPVGQPTTLTVVDGREQADTPIADATITGTEQPTSSDADGRASIRFDSPGIKRLRAERADSLHSATKILCVSGPGETCENLPAIAGAVQDSSAPRARISGLRDGQRLRRGPRVLRGTASDDVGVAEVKITLRRHAPGKPCQWWSARRERFVGTSCDKRFFFAVGRDRNWSYLLPRRLPAGRYVLDVKAFDRSRNRDERFVRGQNRIVFHVGTRKTVKSEGAARRGPGAVGTSRARGVPVQVMVTGRSATLAKPRTVRARTTTVRAGKRRCRIAGATPLAALAATMRSADYRVRDFGSCSKRSPAGSGQLFVNRIGPDRNAGSDGWFYKVGGRAGTAGAADPVGPFGNGKLRRGTQVLWFFCVFEQATGSCQRTLAIDAARKVKRGGLLPVRVVGYDNEGRAQPVAGALVTLGDSSATTGPDGRCSVVAAASGSLALRAERAGMVAAFPQRVAVK